MKSDMKIQEDVMAELKWEPTLSASEIGVAVHAGVVTLSGNVNSYMKKNTGGKGRQKSKGCKSRGSRY